MSDHQKKQLERQLWNIADTLRGKMDADEFRDYILGFIFYKYLSEKMHLVANTLLEDEPIKEYTQLDETTEEGIAYLEAIKTEAIEELGYFLKPSELFSQIAKRGNAHNIGIVMEEEVSYGDEPTNTFILEDLENILKNIEQSTMERIAKMTLTISLKIWI